MSQLTRYLIALAALALVFGSIAPAAPASLERGGVCTLEFHVLFDTGGEIEQAGAGIARCAGIIGETSVDPFPVSALLNGTARAGVTGCTPIPAQGRLTMDLLQLISFDPHREMPFDGDWAATGVDGVSALSGYALAGSVPVRFLGEVRFTPNDGQTCAFQKFSGGTLQMELLVGDVAGARVPLRRSGLDSLHGPRKR
jgi:hypothetical protein